MNFIRSMDSTTASKCKLKKLAFLSLYQQGLSSRTRHHLFNLVEQPPTWYLVHPQQYSTLFNTQSTHICCSLSGTEAGIVVVALIQWFGLHVLLQAQKRLQRTLNTKQLLTLSCWCLFIIKHTVKYTACGRKERTNPHWCCLLDECETFGIKDPSVDANPVHAWWRLNYEKIHFVLHA